MRSTPHTFDAGWVRRIIEAVRRVERMFSGSPTLPGRDAWPPHYVLRGKLNESLTRGTAAAPTSAAMSIWIPGDGGSDAWTDSDQDVTIYDNGFFPASRSPIPSGTWVEAHPVGGVLMLCNADLC